MLELRVCIIKIINNEKNIIILSLIMHVTDRVSPTSSSIHMVQLLRYVADTMERTAGLRETRRWRSLSF